MSIIRAKFCTLSGAGSRRHDDGGNGAAPLRVVLGSNGTHTSLSQRKDWVMANGYWRRPRTLRHEAQKNPLARVYLRSG
jgi:hypothetical protein